VRSSEVNNPAWPRTSHDNLATGFSPLNCGMKEAPRVWGAWSFGGKADWFYALHEPNGPDRMLVYDGRLRLVDRDGKVKWTVGVGGSPVYYGALGGRRRGGESPNAILFASGPHLLMLDPETGATRWTYGFGPSHVQLRVVIEDILLELPGLEAAVAQQWGEDGCLINFPPDGEPRVVWQSKLVIAGEYDERYDHGCDLRVDLSDPGRPVIWNVRRFRCRGFDARTGKMLSSLAYEIGGEQRRNYGTWELGRGKRGEPLAVVVGEDVQVHVHAIRLRRDGANELAWQHYYGEVYKDAFGVALQNLAIRDVDADGATEVAYSVRDPQRGFRSFVEVRDAGTGDVESSLPDHWGVTAFSSLGADRSSGLVACAAPNGGMPKQGDLEIFRYGASGKLEQVATLPRAQLWGPGMLDVEGRKLLMVRQKDEAGAPTVSLFDVVDGKLKQAAGSTSGALADHSPQALMQTQDGALGGNLFLVVGEDGRLTANSWTGETRWQLDLQGGSSPTMSAADLNNDGRAELLAVTPNKRVQVLSFDDAGAAHELASHEYAARWSFQSPALYDLEGNGEYCLIAPASAADGALTVAAHKTDGSTLWKTKLDIQADSVDSFVALGGKFLPGGRAAVAVTVGDNRRTREGTYLLHGQTGQARWFKGLYHNGPMTMPYRAHGTPTAFDFDKDGDEEIGIDLLSYMAYLNGDDGSFVFVRHTPNIRTEDATYAGHLYNTYRPIYRVPGDDAPHWFVSGGYGAFGLMNPDVVSGVWRTDLGYDTPPAIGMIDVDSDGTLEIGYAALNSPKFICRDLWTGEVEWELDLPSAPNAPCLSADVDGDGRGEFLIGGFCIGVDENGQGALRWQSPLWMGWAVIADFDGDGVGEIACAQSGGVAILKGSSSKPSGDSATAEAVITRP
jgi:outer membrane protein assembly factor BamB